MRQQLWQLNSSLLLIFTITLGICFLLKKPIPSVQFKPAPPSKIQEKEPIENRITIDTIFKKDLFGTYKEAPITPEGPFINPIPEPKPPKMQQIPIIKKPDFLQPLPIKLKGILFSTNPEKSLVLIEDEAGKEQSYYLDDQIKDGQIIKINKEKVIILRINGQQETIFLKKEENFLNTPKEEKWDGIIKKIDDFNFQINPIRFKDTVPSLGQFLDSIDPITVYQQGKPLGIYIGKIYDTDFSSAIGIQEKDLIISVNGIKLNSPEERYKAYESIINSKIKNSIKVNIKRSNQEISLNYQLTPLEKNYPKFGLQPNAKPQYVFQMSREQTREQQRRLFNREHPATLNEINEILRQRYLDNLNMREKNMRFRN